MIPPVDFPTFVAVWNRCQGLETPRHHLRIAGWLQARWQGGDRHLLLMAFRASGKSTLVGLFAAWMLYRQPEARLLVLAAELSLARKMVRNTKRLIERHPLTQGMKPGRPEQWAMDQFTIVRPVELRDPSMLARGILANITGSRADLVICDDVEVPNTSDTAVKRADLRARLAEVDYVLTQGGGQLYVGTPHSYYTLYAAEARPEVGETAPFLAGFRRLEIPLLDAEGASAWPELFTPERIARLRRRTGPAKFESQMQLRPVAIVKGRLDPDRLRPYDHELDYREALGRARLRLGDWRPVSASCWWDPAFGGADADGRSGDGSVIAALFADGEGRFFLHRIVWLNRAGEGEGTGEEDGGEDEATRQCRAVAAFLDAHHLPAVAVETNGLGRFLPGLLRRELARARVPATVREIASRKPKSQRILEAFDAVLAAGALHAHRSVWDTPFVAEMRDWRPGGGGRDDGLDAVAGCLSLEPVRLDRPPRPPAGPDWRR